MDNAQTTAPGAAASGARRARPLSPHIQVYRFTPTMTASIFHRATGIALYFGTLLVAWWLLAAAWGPGAYDIAAGVLTSWFGLLVMFGYTVVLVMHALGGIRHFIWDTGALMDKFTATKLAWLTFGGAVGITVLIWAIALLAL